MTDFSRPIPRDDGERQDVPLDPFGTTDALRPGTPAAGPSGGGDPFGGTDPFGPNSFGAGTPGAGPLPPPPAPTPSRPVTPPTRWDQTAPPHRDQSAPARDYGAPPLQTGGQPGAVASEQRPGGWSPTTPPYGAPTQGPPVYRSHSAPPHFSAPPVSQHSPAAEPGVGPAGYGPPSRAEAVEPQRYPYGDPPESQAAVAADRQPNPSSGPIRIWAPTPVFWASQLLYGVAAALLVAAIAVFLAVPQLAQIASVVDFTATAMSVRLRGYGAVVAVVLVAVAACWLGRATVRGHPRARLLGWALCGVTGCAALAVVVLQPWDAVSWLPLMLSVVAAIAAVAAAVSALLLARAVSVSFFELSRGAVPAGPTPVVAVADSSAPPAMGATPVSSPQQPPAGDYDPFG